MSLLFQFIKNKKKKGSKFSSHDNIKSSSHIKRISSWLIGFSYMNECVHLVKIHHTTEEISEICLNESAYGVVGGGE